MSKKNNPKDKEVRLNKNQRRHASGSSRRERNNRRDEEYVDETKVGKGANDISWYTKYPKLVTAPSSIIFNRPYGLPINNFNNGGTLPSDATMGQTDITPAVLYRYIPWYGLSGTDTDAVNIAAKNFYTYVRHANSGSTNYEQSDQMQYFITVMDIFANFERVKRILRLCALWSPVNYNVPSKILTLLGVPDAVQDEIRANMANIVARVNLAIAKANTFKIPKDMAILQRRMWLNSTVFADDELDKASFYIFDPEYHLHYDWANAQIHYVQNGAAGSYSSFLTNYIGVLEQEIDNLLNYEDVGIMIGDILKAYKAENCFVLDGMELGEVQDPVFSAEACSQFRNAVIAGTVGFSDPSKVYIIEQVNSNSQLLKLHIDPSNANVPTKKDGVYYGSSFVDSTPFNVETLFKEFNPTLSANSDTPSNEEVIIQTRLSYTLDTQWSASGNDRKCNIEVRNAGTEIIVSASIATVQCQGGDGDPMNWTFKQTYVQTVMLQKYTGAYSALSRAQNLMQLATISYRPQLFLINVDSNDGVTINSLTSGKNNIVLDRQWLKQMHDACVLSEFSIPMFKLLEAQ